MIGITEIMDMAHPVINIVNRNSINAYTIKNKAVDSTKDSGFISKSGLINKKISVPIVTTINAKMSILSSLTNSAESFVLFWIFSNNNPSIFFICIIPLISHLLF